MAYTLGEAAKATGKSKTSIRRALDSGRVSGTKNDLGEWVIEPVELHRVFPMAERGNGSEEQKVARSVTPDGTGGPPLLQAMLEAAEREKALLRELLDRERDISRGLEEDRDHWRLQATALLTDQTRKQDAAPETPEPAPQGRWTRAWSFLRGRT